METNFERLHADDAIGPMRHIDSRGFFRALTQGEQELRVWLLENEMSTLRQMRASAGGENARVWAWGELVRLPTIWRVMQALHRMQTRACVRTTSTGR